MTSSTTRSFRESFANLDPDVRRLAVKQYKLWLTDPRHPSLHFKQVGGSYWSVRIGLTHRAIAKRTSEGFQWFWVGHHADYDKLLERR